MARYTDRLRSFQDSLRSAAANGASPEQAAEVILTAITADRPRNRYTVGAAAGLVGALEPLAGLWTAH